MAGQAIVGEVMTRRVYAVGPDTSIETVARLMATKRFSGCPVIDPEGYPIGVVSLVDIVDPDRSREETFGFDSYFEVKAGDIRAHGGGGQIAGGRVKEIMTSEAVSISASAPVRKAAEMMVAGKIHRLLVVDFDRLLGILTSLDVTRVLTNAR